MRHDNRVPPAVNPGGPEPRSIADCPNNGHQETCESDTRATSAISAFAHASATTTGRSHPSVAETRSCTRREPRLLLFAIIPSCSPPSQKSPCASRRRDSPSRSNSPRSFPDTTFFECLTSSSVTSETCNHMLAAIKTDSPTLQSNRFANPFLSLAPHQCCPLPLACSIPPNAFPPTHQTPTP